MRELQDIFSLALFTYPPCFAKEAVQTGMSFRHFLPWMLPTTVPEAMGFHKVSLRQSWVFPRETCGDGIMGTEGDCEFLPLP